MDYFREKAFWIAEESLAVYADRIKDAIIKGREEGTILADFRDTVKEMLGVSKVSDRVMFHIENIYLTANSLAYNGGRERQQAAPEIATSRPYLAYVGTLDPATRVTHAKMQRLSLAGKVWHRDHPIWKTMYPSNGWR